MKTVRDRLIADAGEFGIGLEEYASATFETYFEPAVPERYRRRVIDVFLRLPEDWDAARTWSVELSSDLSPRGYASVRREEEAEGEIEQIWIMTLYPSLFDRLSDAASRWVIAHEFGHIASGLSMGTIVIEGVPYTRVKGTAEYEPATETDDHEDVAEQFALEWGFSAELQAFLKEED